MSWNFYKELYLDEKKIFCIFCNGINHVSQNCNIYVSDEDRKKVLHQKNHCVNCLSAPEPYHGYSSYCHESKPKCYICYTITSKHASYCHYQNTGSNMFPIDNNQRNCRNCEFNEKCFICFSREHHTVFCPDRFTAPFPPNIDRVLMSRFLKLLTDAERYLVCLSFPAFFDSIKPKPLKIKYQKQFYAANIKNVMDSDIVIANEARIKRDSHFRDFLNIKNMGSIGLPPTATVNFRFQCLEIHSSSLFSNEFLQLLSPYTKRLSCGLMEFLPNLKFREILLKAPNLENINLQKTNVEIDNLWPDNLLHLSTATELKNVHLKIDADFIFNVETLVALMKKKSAKICLTIDAPPNKNIEQIVKNKLSNYFTPFISNSHSLTIVYVDGSIWCNKIATEKYEVKKC